MVKSIIFALAVVLVAVAHAEVKKPDEGELFEVKFPIKGSLVGEDHRLKDSIRTALGIKPDAKTTKIRMAFLDRPLQHAKHALNARGWLVRCRTKESKKDGPYKRDLTYKRRVKLNEGDEKWERALAEAKKSLDGDTEKYEYQVEWGPERMTVSLAYSVKETKIASEELPEDLELRETAQAKRPLAMGRDKLPDLRFCHVFGPTRGWRWPGTIAGIGEIDVEVFEVWHKTEDRLEFIAEVSFKTDSEQDARTNRVALRTFLTDKGYLESGDAKTNEILLRYTPR